MQMPSRLTLTLLLSLCSCAPSATPTTTCDPVGDVVPLCGWQNPEDLALLPDSRFVVVSEYGDMNGLKPGQLSALHLDTFERLPLFAGVDDEGDATWGDDACPGQPGPAFSPHGLHLVERDDGAWQLSVVQHGARESVELFEVHVDRGDDGDRLRVQWRGCWLPPPETLLNDVVALSDGQVFATKMMAPTNAVGMMATYAAVTTVAPDTGHVLRWAQGEGVSVVDNTSGSMPNGIEARGRELFINYSGVGEIRVVDVDDAQVKRRMFFDALDNATWAPDGRLLVAEARADSADAMACFTQAEDAPVAQCPIAYAIVAVDPDTLMATDFYVGGDDGSGAPVADGAGTVGLLVDDDTLLVGTFAGDRIALVRPSDNAP